MISVLAAEKDTMRCGGASKIMVSPEPSLSSRGNRLGAGSGRLVGAGVAAACGGCSGVSVGAATGALVGAAVGSGEDGAVGTGEAVAVGTAVAVGDGAAVEAGVGTGVGPAPQAAAATQAQTSASRTRRLAIRMNPPSRGTQKTSPGDKLNAGRCATREGGGSRPAETQSPGAPPTRGAAPGNVLGRSPGLRIIA